MYSRDIVEQRIKCATLRKKLVSAEDAAQLIKDGMVVATSGFTPAGYPKAVPLALAERATAGEKIGITLITGASVGPEMDTALVEADVIRRRYPYQTNQTIRDAINSGKVQYADIHLSHVPVWIKMGYLGQIDMAIVEACAIDKEGHIYLSTSGGISDTAIACASQVIIEVNTRQPLSLIGMHDIYPIALPPNTCPIPLTHPNQRIGKPYVECNPEKIAAIVMTDLPDRVEAMASIDDVSVKMADNLINFLYSEVRIGRLPQNLLPLQSGVGSVANAVLGGLIKSNFEHLTIFSEVLQDSVLDLLDAGKVDFASATALTISQERQPDFFANIDRYKNKIMIRPQEISNHPELIRRLGIIAMNTAIEVDIYGNVNSTHIGGSRLMNGIGGSGDFTRNGAISIFTTASTSKGGLISSIVPTVSHTDHSEHSVQVIVTEQGVADLRGLSPIERAQEIISNCAHQDYKPMLRSYLYEAFNKNKYLHIPIK